MRCILLLKCVLVSALLFLFPQVIFACGWWCGCSPCVSCCWIPCCQPCCVFHVSEPPVPIDGPFPKITRWVCVGEGVIAQFDVPSAIHPGPVDPPEVFQTGGEGRMLYYGWNKCVLYPGRPGGPIRYSIFLCGYRVGECDIEVWLKYTDGSIHKAKYRFHIYDFCYR